MVRPHFTPARAIKRELSCCKSGATSLLLYAPVLRESVFVCHTIVDRKCVFAFKSKDDPSTMPMLKD